MYSIYSLAWQTCCTKWIDFIWIFKRCIWTHTILMLLLWVLSSNTNVTLYKMSLENQSLQMHLMYYLFICVIIHGVDIYQLFMLTFFIESLPFWVVHCLLFDLLPQDSSLYGFTFGFFFFSFILAKPFSIMDDFMHSL